MLRLEKAPTSIKVFGLFDSFLVMMFKSGRKKKITLDNLATNSELRSPSPAKVPLEIDAIKLLETSLRKIAELQNECMEPKAWQQTGWSSCQVP